MQLKTVWLKCCKNDVFMVFGNLAFIPTIKTCQLHMFREKNLISTTSFSRVFEKNDLNVD